MPYAFATYKKKIPRELDRRVKLSSDDIEIIKHLYFKNKLAIRAIARMYAGKCTRRVIQYTLKPELYVKQLQTARKRRQLKGNAFREYGKEAWNSAMRDHRRYKQSIKDKLI
jgi:hypothetical protein